MGLWGASDADESKPKHLTTAEKKQVFARNVHQAFARRQLDFFKNLMFVRFY